ncbi:uncharacterized protein LOC125471685 isoform X2 [Pyrus x bretschneideri]|uniref:uncharacterized protein LOC125471685 isoform X2 n=1 Tax=Pyrus x bretschneideri TaxID=225117 RepID=UPI00202E8477|nr:uncharacterized protein LOC125471685 isoform X2 [Pyrus x bretschneideri]
MYEHSHTISMQEFVVKILFLFSFIEATRESLAKTVYKLLPKQDLSRVGCFSPKSYIDFEVWHLELISGLVILISLSRYLLLKTWPDFAESSEAANQQVLTSLQPLDYIIVAFLPGVSEELLFRGALLPLFGSNWRSALIVAIIFGVLHLGSGRKYSFAVCQQFGWRDVMALPIRFITDDIRRLPLSHLPEMYMVFLVT